MFKLLFLLFGTVGVLVVKQERVKIRKSEKGRGKKIGEDQKRKV